MYRKYISFYLLLLYLFSTVNSFTVQFSHQLSNPDIIGHFLGDKLLEEGFCAGTLVKTPCGYGLIENLVIGDVVVDAYGNQTEIVAITRRCVDQYVKIFLNDTIVCMGCDQKFYLPSDSTWIRARDGLFHNEYITYPAVIYALTTQSHTLCVTVHNLCAHNAAAVFCGASSVCFGYVAVVNPVVTLFGGVTVALAVVAYNAYQEYLNKHVDKDDSFFTVIPDAVILADRFYYELRKSDLVQVKQELLSIKDDLEKIRSLYSTNFTYKLLKHHRYDAVKNVQSLSVVQEKCLSEEQKCTLREAREAELALLEAQIQDIQFLLALHVNQLIDNMHHAQTLYDSAISNIQESIAVWNNNLKAMTNEIALKMYRYDLLRESLVYGINQAVDELFVVINYYHGCTNVCIQKSTTIVAALEYLAPVISEKRRWVAEEKNIVDNNIAISEQYFAKQNISTIPLKNEVEKESEKQKKERADQVLQKVEMERLNTRFGGGPKKDDDEEREHCSKVQIYEKNAPHIFRNESGHFSLDTPVNRKLLTDAASDVKNFLGKCKYGNEWYGKILENGQQVWASVRNGFIRNGGLNKFPHNFNFETGLCRLIK